MNCTRVLQILNPRPMPSPIMPVDVAMRICLAHSPPIRSFLSSYKDCKSRNLVNQYKPLRSCISSKTDVDTASLGWKSPETKAKKKVVFADSKGMSLTAVHVFKEFEEDSMLDLQFELSDLEDAIVGLKAEEKGKNLILDFPQPAADYLDFRNSLKKNLVCLENCIIQEISLTGTVKVINTFQVLWPHMSRWSSAYPTKRMIRHTGTITMGKITSWYIQRMTPAKPAPPKQQQQILRIKANGQRWSLISSGAREHLVDSSRSGRAGVISRTTHPTGDSQDPMTNLK